MNEKPLSYDSIRLSAISACSALLLCCLILQSCSPKIAEVNLPYDTLQNFSLPGEAEVSDRWWTAFGDETLNALVEAALDSNLSLRTTWYQLQEARSIAAISSSGLFPATDLELQSGISRPEPDFVGGENTQLSVGASYELDLWGRIRYNVHADRYRAEASRHDYRAASISLSAEIALTWFRLKATNNLLYLIDEQIANNEKVLSLIRTRFASGQVRGVDILRQEQLIEATRAQKITLEVQAGVLRNQLSVLLGQPPGTFQGNVSQELPELPPMPRTGLPLKLVNRRPDIQSAFYRLQASDRAVAAAVSSKYPRLSFSLTAAIRSNTFSNLFQSQALSLSSSILTPLFYGGRLNAIVDQTEAVRHQRLNAYGQIVLNAFLEVENALLQETKQSERISVIQEQVELAEKTNGQLRIEYLHGSIPYLDVLVSLNQEQQLRRDLINATVTLIEIRIALYRALAGGFETTRENMEANGS